MTNEKGFATLFSLCLILVIALIVKGIQESEMNHAYETADFQTELDLQNAADSGIYAAAKIVRSDPDILPFNQDPYAPDPRKISQYKFEFEPPLQIKSKYYGDINIEVWGERMAIKSYNVVYGTKYTANLVKTEENFNRYLIGYTLLSKAEIDKPRTGGKIYRRSLAYVVEKIAVEKIVIGKNNKKVKVMEFTDVEDSEKNVIHFVELPANNYTYKN